MRNEEEINVLIEKGNLLFSTGKKRESIPYYIQALIQSNTLKIIVKYVITYRKNMIKNLPTLIDLLKIKYHITIRLDALIYLLRATKNDIDRTQKVQKYQRFKELFLAKNPTSLNDYVHLFLLFYGENYQKKLSMFISLLHERGFQTSPTEIEHMLIKHEKILKLDQFEQRLLQHGLKKDKNIDTMTGPQFEEFLHLFFQKQGYKVMETKQSHDFGSDLILKRFGERTVVQVKRQNKPVGMRAVQEVVAAQKYYHCPKAMVIISSTFTKPALDLAKCNNVELWDRKMLLHKLQSYSLHL